MEDYGVKAFGITNAVDRATVQAAVDLALAAGHNLLQRAAGEAEPAKPEGA